MSSSDIFDRRGWRRFIIVACLWVGFIVMAAACSIVVWGLLHFDLGPQRFRDGVSDPSGDFEELTGLAWPKGAEIVSVDDTHGGFHGDGEFYLVFDADPATISAWLQDQPPWEQSDWSPGPIPTEIVSHCRWKPRPASAEIEYAACERCCDTQAWHNGDLLVIDRAAGRVWYSHWDF